MRPICESTSISPVALRPGMASGCGFHLAAAITVRERACARSESSSVGVASFDRGLLKAAEREGFATLGRSFG